MFGEEVDYEEEERRYLEEQQKAQRELEARNKQFQNKVKIRRGDEEEEDEPPKTSKSYNLDDDDDDDDDSYSNNRKAPQQYDDVDPTDVLNDKKEDQGPTESYLDAADEMSKTFKKTSFGDSNRWGKGGELFDHTTLEVGSFLDTWERDQQTNKLTKTSDVNRWGNYKIPDETEMTQGSFLEKQQKHALEEAERQRKIKEEKIAEIKKEKGVDEYLDPKSNKFPYSELKGLFPKGVEPTKKEQYLSAEEFQQVMGMSAAAYAKLSPFQQKTLKKKVKLF
jgi:hypothetical protein